MRAAYKRMRGTLFGVLACVFVCAPALADEGLSRNMHAAEAAMGREEYDVAAQYFEAECNAGGALGCYNLAIFEHLGRTGPSNPAKSMTLNRRACDLGLADGCANLAVQLLEEENGVARAERLSTKACRRNSATGCHTRALIYEGKYGGPANPHKAEPLFDKACRLGHGAACYRQGFNLARQARSGAQWQKVSDLYLTACDAGNAAGCNALGTLAAEGRTGQPDGTTARTYFDLGCERGSAAACLNLGDLLRAGKLVSADEAAARQAFQRAERLSAPLPVNVHSDVPIP